MAYYVNDSTANVAPNVHDRDCDCAQCKGQAAQFNLASCNFLLNPACFTNFRFATNPDQPSAGQYARPAPRSSAASAARPTPAAAAAAAAMLISGCSDDIADAGDIFASSSIGGKISSTFSAKPKLFTAAATDPAEQFPSYLQLGHLFQGSTPTRFEQLLQDGLAWPTGRSPGASPRSHYSASPLRTPLPSRPSSRPQSPHP